MREKNINYEQFEYSAEAPFQILNVYHTENVAEGAEKLEHHWHSELEITYVMEGNKTFHVVDGQQIKDICGKAVVVNSDSIHNIIPDYTDVRMGNIASADTEAQDFKLMKEFLPGGATEDELHDISVVNFVTGDFPPAFVMTADGDFLKDGQLPLIAKLLECNVQTVFRYYTIKGGDPLGHVFHCNMKLDEATRCNDEECNFFKSFVK